VKILIVGAGAIGSLLGGLLQEGGNSVLLVGRADHVAAVRTTGLKVSGPRERVVHPEAATAIPEGADPEIAIVTAKTFDLAPATTALARTLSPRPVLFLQNGLAILTAARAALGAGGWPEPAPYAVRGVNSLPATWVGPGEVREAGRGEILLPVPGEAGPAAGSCRLFRMVLEGARVPVEAVPEFEREIWRKALLNAAINPVTALRGIPNGGVLKEPARTQALQLLGEALAVARSEGFGFTSEEVTRDFEQIARATAANRSSMLQDLDRGRPTEIDAISGEILRAAEAHGLDLPATRAIVEEIRARTPRSASRPQPS
jgi:2-dehydropantoate 2-reductase